MLHLVQTQGPRAFYANDRNTIINAACGLLEKEYHRPLDALEDLLTLQGYRVIRRPLAGRQWSVTQRANRTVIVCSNLEFKLSCPESLAGVYNFTLACELAHIRLHLSQVKKLTPTHREEAKAYAAVFLIPRRDLVALPEFQDLLSACRAGISCWGILKDLADHFGVTRSCLLRGLEDLGFVVYDPETRCVRIA